MKSALLRGLFLGALVTIVLATDNFSAVHEVSEGQYSWRVEIPQIDQITFTETGVEYPGWNTTVNEHGFTVPVLSKMIFTSNGKPEINVFLTSVKNIPLPDEILPVVEQAKGIALTVSKIAAESSTDWYSTKLIRDDGSSQLWAVNVTGAQIDPVTGKLVIPDNIVLTIHSDLKSSEPLDENSLFLNKISNTSLNKVTSRENGLGAGKIKLHVLEDGIYRITYTMLGEIEGFPEGSIDSRTLTLRNKGKEQAIHVFDGGDGRFDRGDYLDFIGKQNYFSGPSQYYDPFSDVNVYWLDWGAENGLRFVEESGALVSSNPVQPKSFWDVAHIEEDLIFDRLGQVDTDLPTITRDHHFWTSVNSGQNMEVGFTLPDPFRGSSENVEISIGLHGLTYTEGSGEGGEHTLFAFLNDESVGKGSWTQQEEFTLISPSAVNLSHNILSASGNNVLAVFAPVSTQAGAYDRIVVNWLEVGYEHLLTADDNRLRFRKSHINPDTNLEFEVRGFTSSKLVIYKEALSKITGYSIREVWDAQNPTFNLVFQDEVTDATPDYWAATVESLLEPAHISMDTLSSLRDEDGDFIIITIPEYVNGLETYLEFKRDEDWNPIVISLEDIYDEFNYGIKSPYAIKSFLRYANNYWASRPDHVMLIGDASTNPRKEKLDIRNTHVPTFYMQTYGWGAAEADFWYTLINGDDYLPDMNIGRLPVSNEDDLDMTLDKLIRYNSGNNYGSWQNEIIVIAGFETTFKYQSESLLSQEVPKASMPSRVFIDRDSEGNIFWGDTDSLITLWNDGKLLINFLGHGGGAVWADRSLFVRDDIALLDEDAPPAMVTSMTCFTGSFAQSEGLGEVVLTNSPTGAIGWLGSSGVGWLINDYLMIQPMLRRLLESHKTIGEVMNIARMEYYLSNSGYDYLKPSMLFQYNYLGDPTTRLALPDRANNLQSEKHIYAQTDTLKVSYASNETGTLKLLPINANGQPWWKQPAVHELLSSNQFAIEQEAIAYNSDSTSIITPSRGESRTIYTLDRGPDLPAVQGYASYSISSNWFEHAPPTADELEGVNDISLRTSYHSSTDVPDSMTVTFSGANNIVYNLVKNGDWWELQDSTDFVSGNRQTHYYFAAYQNGNMLQSSPYYRLYLPDDVSLTLNAVRESARGKYCGLEFQYTLLGINEISAELNHVDSASGYVQKLIQDVILKNGNNTLFVPTYFGSGEVDIRSSLRADEDTNPADDTLRATLTPSFYQIIPGKGISFTGQSKDSVNLWATNLIYSSGTDTSWLQIQVHQEAITSTSGISFDSGENIYQIETSGPESGVMVTSNRSLFLKHSKINNWQILDNNGTSYVLNGSGLIAKGSKLNTTGPKVSMMMEGQLFFDGDYILNDSRLNLIAEDDDGFTWKNEDVEVQVDGVPMEVELGDTIQAAKILSISADLELLNGEHQISYRVRDALMNWSEMEDVSAVVAGSAQIIDYGNFPNPFGGETLIIYELTQPLDNVSIDIYTIAGYKILSIDEFAARVGIPLGAIGYHEVPWNGRDRNDDFVANGVYFYRICGDLDGETIYGPVSKMVKNR